MKKAILAALVLALFAVSAAVAATPTVRLLTDSTGIDDKSFNAAAWRGILEFYGDTWAKQTNRGKLYDVVTAQTQDMYVPNLKQAADEKYDLIIVTGFTWAEALGEVAPQYPNQKFMIVDVDWVTQPNVMQVTFSEHEGSFLVGVAAALKAKADGIKNPKFGFIGGIPGPVITKFEVGYVMGILSVRLGQAGASQGAGQELVRLRRLRHLLSSRRHRQRDHRPGQGIQVPGQEGLGHRSGLGPVRGRHLFRHEVRRPHLDAQARRDGVQSGPAVRQGR
jgi:hypothetical protein